uniref:Ig-like domain-containing protein n=1 Tax=Electrophorus electricus TaxID=8005 RepID=A0AAY5EGM5_ELEEL
MLKSHSLRGGPDVPVVAAPGSDIILPCSIKPKASEQSHVSAVDMEVKWSRTDLNSAVVHHYMDKIDKNEDQDPSYRGRTALFKEELQYGNTSLLLKNVKVSDGGQYTFEGECIGGAPEITVLGTDSGGVLLQCDSKGWWPVPELQWLDSEGAEVRAGVTESCEDGEGFYVRRSLTAHSSDTNTYICRVKWGWIFNLNLFHCVPDHLPRPDYTAAIAVPVVLILLSALVGVVVYYRRRGKPVSVTQYIPVPQSSYLVCLCQECLILRSSSPETLLLFKCHIFRHSHYYSVLRSITDAV